MARSPGPATRALSSTTRPRFARRARDREKAAESALLLGSRPRSCLTLMHASPCAARRSRMARCSNDRPAAGGVMLHCTGRNLTAAGQSGIGEKRPWDCSAFALPVDSWDANRGDLRHAARLLQVHADTATSVQPLNYLAPSGRLVIALSAPWRHYFRTTPGRNRPGSGLHATAD